MKTRARIASGTVASLDRPFGVAFAPDGALLIADRLHSRIRRVDQATGVITTIVGTRTGFRDDVPADRGELAGPLSYPIARGRGVAFASAFGARNQCTPSGEFVVQRRRRAGKSKLAALIATQASGRDSSRLKLVCLCGGRRTGISAVRSRSRLSPSILPYVYGAGRAAWRVQG